MRFRDRADAGRQLAWRLQQDRMEAPVVVGLPRGGLPVAAEVARTLGAPLDVLAVRKLGCPWEPELALGAVGEEGALVLNPALIAGIGLAPQDLADVIRAERGELERRLARYRGNRPAVPVAGRTVIVVDDGLATGATARAAIRVLRRRGAHHIVLAVPVAPPETVKALGAVADEVVALETPRSFLAIGQSYDDFGQTSDQEVTRLLGAREPAPAKATTDTEQQDPARECVIDLGPVRLAGDLATPLSPIGIVVFAHGTGSGRHSPRNRQVAHLLNQSRLATLLLDLLTPAEEEDRAKVFDIELLARRLTGAARWLQAQPEARGLPVGFFGASTGAAAALWAAADLGDQIRAVVSRGGRPDRAAPRLAEVRAPTLLIVGGHDQLVLELNRQAQAQLRGPSALQVIAGAGHLFEEPGALDRVAALAAAWFRHHLPHPSPAQPRQTPHDPSEPSSGILAVPQG
ncbi:MAG TPA: phosphoribosyltransferase family protein [Actinomycetota bacterium]